MLGVPWHAATVLANATGHQLSCAFGSVLRFLGTISQHHHHGWGAPGKGQSPPDATPHPGFLHLHWAHSDGALERHSRLEGCIASSQRGITALFHAGGAAGIQPGLPCSCWLCSCTLELAPWAPAPDTCACQRLCCCWEQLSTCSKPRHHPPPSQNPSGGAAPAVKGFSSSFPLCVPHEWQWQGGRVEFEPLMLCFSAVAFLNVAGKNPNSALQSFPSSTSTEMWGLFTSSSSFTSSHWILPAIRKQQVWELGLCCCLLSPSSLSGNIFAIWGKETTNATWISVH